MAHRGRKLLKKDVSKCTEAKKEEQEQLDFDACRAQMEDVMRAREKADSDMRDQLVALVESYKSTCQGLMDSRAACLQRMLGSSTAVARKSLDGDSCYPLWVPDRAVFAKSGVVVFYTPDRDGKSDTDGAASEMAAPVDLSESPACHLDDLHKEHRDSYLPGTEQGRTGAEPPPIDRATPGIAMQRTLRSRTSEIVNPLASRSLRPPTARRQPTLQPPIKITELRKLPYWVFEYRFSRGLSLCTLRCPSPTCSAPVFSKHPLKRSRAASHLKSCGVPFRNERDIIRKYARVVVTGRHDREVTLSWARKHNATLLASNERGLEQENL
ncbi:hypothetical protein NKR23_g5234 [Pleurostoma richardsiae]|uniref:Uncharacterized protein n=1 Tax=Pleurostoma richardsiae TaxID=41990 RepID=A0AA38VR93_9PEZI|nr:hypothetical protein NKR23_g5234 [Pleurostoma richardsiae]